MRFDQSKAWPHPVLRPPAYGNDYPDAEFEADIDVLKTPGSTSVSVKVVYQLSDPDLLRLIESDRANYVLLIRATGTHYREAIVSGQDNVDQQLPSDALLGRVTLSPFVVCREDVEEFRSAGWHPDFGTRSYEIRRGTVLAEDMPKDYWIDIADEKPLGSIIGHKSASSIGDGHWKIEIDDDRIWIVMSNADSEQYNKARDRVNETSEGQYLMNGLYLPALVTALHKIDQDAKGYFDCKWFASLDKRLEDIGGSELGTNADRLVDAQKILEAPMLRMPLFREAND